MDRQSLKIPKLVNADNFIKVNVIENIENGVNVKWNLNKILLILFGIFLVVFLCVCKYGKPMEEEPVPYSFVYNFKNLKN